MKHSSNRVDVNCRRRIGELAALGAAVALMAGCASSGSGARRHAHHGGHDAGHVAANFSSGEIDSAAAESSESAAASMAERWGVELLGVRRTAADYALHFRYRVLDPEKAAPILQRKQSRNPHLIVEKSGAILRVPFSEKVGTMRQSVRTVNQIKTGRTYYALFANPGRHVEAGDLVTVVIGDFEAPHIVVE